MVPLNHKRLAAIEKAERLGDDYVILEQHTSLQPGLRHRRRWDLYCLSGMFTFSSFRFEAGARRVARLLNEDAARLRLNADAIRAMEGGEK